MTSMKITKSYLKNLVYEVNGAAIEVHKELDPGLLESVYHKCLKQELFLRKINFNSEVAIPVDYKGELLNVDLRCDFIIENCLVVELKAVEVVLPVHEAQILTYMKLLKFPKGLLINFNCEHIFKHGQKTFVNEAYRLLEN